MKIVMEEAGQTFIAVIVGLLLLAMVFGVKVGQDTVGVLSAISSVAAVKAAGGAMFICADHGNAEQLIDEETGAPFTAHTTNPVPFLLINYDPEYTLKEGGCLADIIPTMIEMMGMEQPKEMTGKSLHEFSDLHKKASSSGNNLVNVQAS